MVAQLPGLSRRMALRCLADNLVAKKQWYRAVALSKCPVMKVSELQSHQCTAARLLHVCGLVFGDCMALKVSYLI